MSLPHSDTDILGAIALLQRGETDAAEAALARLAEQGHDPRVLHALGSMRLAQSRFGEAEALLSRLCRLAPHQPRAAFGHGQALAGLGRDEEALAAFETAITLKPDFADAYYEMGAAYQRLRRFQDAEKAYRRLLAVVPGHVPAKLALGAVLIEARRPVEAEVPLRAALQEPAPPRLAAMIHTNLGLALRHQRKDEEALAHYQRAAALEPSLPGLDVHRAEAQQNLKRYAEALSTYRHALAREPADPGLHRLFNDLLYRLGHEDYLKSYDSAPKSRELMLGKAAFLAREKRGQECHAIYEELLRRDEHDPAARIGLADSLLMLQRHGEAMASYARVLARRGGDVALLTRVAQAALIGAEPERALSWCEQGLAVAPHDQACLAATSVALRMLEDERDEALNGYDTLIAALDLEPPQGFSDMEAFHAELNSYLERLHPQTREHLHQSLRGGTQTPDHLFDAGHALIGRLQERITQAVAGYIAALARDDKHPFLSRRGNGFRYAGSWSSKLKDCGFHVNHIHPDGWISSCYYIGVPDAVWDRQARQGWIKFGEPGLEVALKNPIRRAIQPVPGRLVLFPSYMWHGTIPFRDAAPRTTIAFDVVPSVPGT